MSLLLELTSSAMDTLPLCLMKLATACSSWSEIKMNLPLSSTTPLSAPLSCSACTRAMASYSTILLENRGRRDVVYLCLQIKLCC